MATEHAQVLNSGYKLHWYRIIKVLGQGGFGITYLVEDENLQEQVAIKKYFPSQIASRSNESEVQPLSENNRKDYDWGLGRFIDEARTLTKFRHPAITRVRSVFEENGTAYMVMDFEEGDALDEILKGKKTLPEEQIRAFLLPLIDGLKEVHQVGFIHRDIKPANIIIKKDRAVLIDFGSARQSLNQQTMTLTQLVSPGYAPFEQYQSDSTGQGPWTDAYALAATMYRAATGITPPQAIDRSRAVLETNRDVYVSALEICGENYSQPFLRGIDHGLAFRTNERPQTMEDWQRDFQPTQPVARQVDESESVTEAVSEAPTQATATREPETTVARDNDNQAQSKSTSWKWYALTSLFLVVIAGFSYKLWVSEPEAPPTPKLDISTETSTPKVIMAQQEPDDSGDLVDDAETFEDAILEPDIKKEKKEEATPEATQTDDDIQQQEIDALLKRADEDIKAMRLTSPKGNNALEKFNRVLTLDTDNETASDGINRVIDKYITIFDNSLSAKDFDRANSYLGRIRNIHPDSPVLIEGETRLETAKQTEQDRQLEEQRKEVHRVLMENEHVKKENEIRLQASKKEKYKLIQIVIDNMIDIPGGTFRMGNSKGNISDKPVREVKISSFKISKYEVTVEQFKYFVDSTNYEAGVCTQKPIVKENNWNNPGYEQTGKHPVTCMSYQDVLGFINWLNEGSEMAFRLPSEAESEYILKKGNKEFEFKSNKEKSQLCMYGNLNYTQSCNDGYEFTSPVGSYKPNGFGVYNMIGNVFEYTADCRHRNFIGAPDDGSAWVSNCYNEGRITRGGSYQVSDTLKAINFRIGRLTSRHLDVGFRLAHSISHDKEKTDKGIVAKGSAQGNTDTEALKKVIELVNSGSYIKAADLLEPIADSGDVKAKSILAYLYFSQHWASLNGENKKKAKLFMKESKNEIIKAANKGKTWEMIILAKMYHRGWGGVEKDDKKRFELLQSAAKTDDVLAQFLMGKYYQYINYSEAIRWYTKAGELGFADAFYELSLMHRDGKGVQKSKSEALNLLIEAAELGSALAQYSLGTMYRQDPKYNKYGIGNNMAEGLKWSRLAAKQGHPNSILYLFEIGEKVDTDRLCKFWPDKAGLRCRKTN